jgi:hypothetical protein
MKRVLRLQAYAPRSDEDRERVAATMRGAHRYRNTLVEIERGRRAAIREIERCPPEEMAARAALDCVLKIADEIKAIRSETRRLAVSKEKREQLTLARGAYHQTLRALSEARRHRRVEVAAELAAVAERESVITKDARELCGVSYGTYLLIEADHAKVRAIPLYDGLEPNDPRFVRWTGDGRVGVQIQGGITAGKLFSQRDTRAKLTALPERDPDKKRSRSNSQLTDASLRVGSDARAPIWITVPVVVHLDLPADAMVKYLVLAREVKGPIESWWLQVTIESSTTKSQRRIGGVLRSVEPPTDGVVGIDVGWRERPDGSIRVAYWADDKGATGELALPAKLVGRLRHIATLRSERETRFQIAKGAVLQWLGATAYAPEWMAPWRASLAQTKSPATLARFANEWRETRQGGDAPTDIVYARVQAWADQDYWDWEEETKWVESAHAARREVYRIWAADLAWKYKTLVIEHFDLRKLAMRKRNLDVADEEPEQETARSNRQLVATHILRLCLQNAFVMRGGTWTHAPAENTTRTCPECGVIEKFDAASILAPTCKNGHTIDQDERAGRNLVERYRDAESTGAAREWKSYVDTSGSESRWAKLKRVKAEKLATAREAGGK